VPAVPAIYTWSRGRYVEELSDKEEDFIDRAINQDLIQGWVCQCVLQEGDGNIVVTLRIKHNS